MAILLVMFSLQDVRWGENVSGHPPTSVMQHSPAHAPRLHLPPRRADRPAGGGDRRGPPAPFAAVAPADGRGSRGSDGGAGVVELADVAAGAVGFGAARRR